MGQVGTELEQGHPEAEVSEWFKRFCSRLGMSPEAPNAWGTVHTQPHVALLVCLLPNIAAASLSCVFILQSQPYRWLHHSLAVIWAASHSAACLMSWRFGPLPPGRRRTFHMCCCGMFTGAYNIMAVLMMFGPEERCIFQSRMLLAVFDALFLWLAAVSGFCGLWPPDVPKTPHRYVRLACLQFHPCSSEFLTN